MIDLPLVMSGVSLLVGLYATMHALKRANKTEHQQDASEMATVIVKLEGIEKGIDEIKTESRSMKTEVKEIRDRLITAEQRLQSAWGMIEELKGK